MTFTTVLIIFGITIVLMTLYYFAAATLAGVLTTGMMYMIFGSLWVAIPLGLLSAFGTVLMMWEDAVHGTAWFK